MGFAASNRPITYSTFPTDNISQIINGLHTRLTSVGWTSVAITGGYKYTIQAPDSTLVAKVKIHDDGFGLATVQFMSFDETRLGYTHKIAPSPGRILQVWANCCQLFTSIRGGIAPGVPLEVISNLSTVAGGILYVPKDLLGECGVDAGPALANEIWWSNGDTSIFDSSNFRWITSPKAWSACYNGNLMVADPSTYSNLNSLRLIPVGITLPWPGVFGIVPRTKFYNSTEPLWFEPILCWGQGPSYDGISRWRGQIYDAVQGSLYAPIDDRIVTQGFEFINYMGDPPNHIDSTRMCSLYLLIGEAGGVGGGAGYMY